MDSEATSPAAKPPAPITNPTLPPASTSDKILTPEKLTRPPPVTVHGGDEHVAGDLSDAHIASVYSAGDCMDLAGNKAMGKLPEKYETLCEFFKCMVRSVRLLQLKRSMPTFSRICRSIEHLTDRRFTYHHLAKMKTIIPEALLIKKVLVYDETTCCMRRELQIVLQPDEILYSEIQKGQTGYSCMGSVFRERIEQFYQDHPQLGEDIPEEELPYPFSKFIERTFMKVSDVSTCTSGTSAILPREAFDIHSSITSTFQPSFSGKIRIQDSEKAPLSCLDKPSYQDDPFTSAPSNAHIATKQPIKKSVFFIHTAEPGALMTPKASIGNCSSGSHSFDGIPAKPQALESTPDRFLSTPARLMASTPDVKELGSGQSAMGCDMSPMKSFKRTARRTILFGAPQTKEKTENEDELTSSLQPPLLQSVREKDIKAFTDNEAGVAEVEKRQTMLSCLADIFNLIHQIFQKGNHTVMTKQELVYKIISCHCEETDRSEVEEQLKLLQELIPEWICEMKALSGDFLYSVNKACCVEEMRERLVGAK